MAQTSVLYHFDKKLLTIWLFILSLQSLNLNSNLSSFNTYVMKTHPNRNLCDLLMHRMKVSSPQLYSPWFHRYFWLYWTPPINSVTAPVLLIKLNLIMKKIRLSSSATLKAILILPKGLHTIPLKTKST